MYRVFIGWDKHEVDAWHVLAHSIYRHASAPISITPIIKHQCPMSRDTEPEESTEFSFSRFLTPWLADFDGPALFMDCDMMVTDDIVKLFQQFNERYAVQVIKHDYECSTARKFLDQVQSPYAKKNWSSVMLFNATKCTYLSPVVVNATSGMFLHQFGWCDESEVGELTPEWGHLVGEYARPDRVPCNIHWTLGGPWFMDYEDTEYANLWFAEKDLMNSSNKRY
jgi:hypothetical protein